MSNVRDLGAAMLMRVNLLKLPFRLRQYPYQSMKWRWC
jgi:hypothetical protein